MDKKEDVTRTALWWARAKSFLLFCEHRLLYVWMKKSRGQSFDMMEEEKTV